MFPKSAQNVIWRNVKLILPPRSHTWMMQDDVLEFESVVADNQSDSIQCLNFAKKWFINIRFNIALPKIHFKILYNSKYYSIKKKSADSIQKIIQFNCKGIIDTGRIGKVPKKCPKTLQNRQKRGLFIKNGKCRSVSVSTLKNKRQILFCVNH